MDQIKKAAEQKQETMVRFLNLCGSLYSFLFLFPFYYALNGIFSQPYSLLLAVIGFLWMIFCGFTGVFYAAKTEKYQKSKVVALNLCQIVIGIVLGGITLGFFYLQGLIWAIISAVFVTAVYFWGNQLYFKNYRYMISPWAFIASVIAFGFGIFLVYLMQKPYNVNFSVIVYIILTALFAVIKNQNNIDRHMDVRHHSMAHLPEKIRRYNIILLSVPLILLLVLYLFKKYILIVLGWGLQLLKYVWIILNTLYVWFIGLFTEQKSHSGTVSAIEEDNSGGGFVTTRMSSFTNALLWVIFIGIMVGVVLIYRREIGEVLGKLFRKLGDLFYNIFHSMGISGAGGGESEYYSDSDEVLDRNEIKSERKPQERKAIQYWKKQVKGYLEEETDETRYREGYRLILQWLELKEIPVEQSDTPNEILKKSEKRVSGNSFVQTTDGYNRLRYGEMICEFGEIQSLRATLEQLLSQSD